MANTYTPTYNILKPEVGSDTNAWGTHINNDLDIVDTHMLSRALTTSQTAVGPMVFGQTFRVNGAVTFDSTLLVTGASSLNSLSTTGSASFGTTVSVTGATTLAAVNITGAATLASNGLNVGSGQLNVTGGNVSMSGNVSAVNASFSGTFGATGNSTIGGTLGVTGAATLSSTLAVSGAASVSNPVTITYAGAGALNINTSGNLNGIRFYNGASITGQIGSNATYPLLIQNNSSSNVIYADSSGNFTAVGNVTAYSDISQKADIETIYGGFELVRRMRGVRYTRVGTMERGVGVIAQEVQKVVPEVVHDNNGILSVAYGNLVGVLIEAIKDLEQRIRVLESK